ncbi:MAG: BTAD domain-containing putative transcriptional regulator, partial [bacterium]
MFRLHTFGSLDLIGPDGGSLDTILAQPKRSLLLAYLAAATPRGYQRRDVLVALFWPELDAERARGALRKALHFLRATLGDAVITRGDEVAVESSMLSCDTVEFERALGQGRLADAMALYRGDFLPGVYAKDAPDVERWIQAERSRLRALAARTAWNLAESAEHNDAPGAARWAALSWSLAPDDEGALRKTMMLLDRVGAKAAALRAYDDFATSLAADFPGATPASATRD